MIKKHFHEELKRNNNSYIVRSRRFWGNRDMSSRVLMIVLMYSNQHTQHFLAFYEYVFQQNIKWCEKNFRENILYLKSLKRFGKQSIIGERIVLRFKGREWEGENEWILLLLWRKSSMSKCLVSTRETRFQLSHPIAWKEDVTNSLIQNRIQVGK